MTHDTHTGSPLHQELVKYETPKQLLKLVAEWKDPFPKPIVRNHDGIKVVRDDLLGFGTKARIGDAVMATLNPMGATVVYVQPRAGWAGLSLAEVCRRRGIRLILFCPACKEASPHQLAAKKAGAELRFVRIAAMPVLQGLARRFAEDRGYFFVPMGLNVPEAVAAVAKVAIGLKLRPERVVYAMSTGVLSRGLQVAWPDARHIGVAVARNLKEGEKGFAKVVSHPLPFLQETRHEAPFPSARNYDLKAYEWAVTNPTPGTIFWNVAGDTPAFDPQDFNSAREWGDQSDIYKK